MPTDYVLQGWDRAADAVRDVRFSELFADGKDTLVGAGRDSPHWLRQLVVCLSQRLVLARESQ